jgi:hypothetical protein
LASKLINNSDIFFSCFTFFLFLIINMFSILFLKWMEPVARSKRKCTLQELMRSLFFLCMFPICLFRSYASASSFLCLSPCSIFLSLYLFYYFIIIIIILLWNQMYILIEAVHIYIYIYIKKNVYMLLTLLPPFNYFIFFITKSNFRESKQRDKYLF